MEEELPKSVFSNTLTILGVDLVVHVLDNGKCIFESDGLDRLFEVMASRTMTAQDSEDIARAIALSTARTGG